MNIAGTIASFWTNLTPKKKEEPKVERKQRGKRRRAKSVTPTGLPKQIIKKAKKSIWKSDNDWIDTDEDIPLSQLKNVPENNNGEEMEDRGKKEKEKPKENAKVNDSIYVSEDSEGEVDNWELLGIIRDLSKSVKKSRDSILLDSHTPNETSQKSPTVVKQPTNPVHGPIENKESAEIPAVIASTSHIGVNADKPMEVLSISEEVKSVSNTKETQASLNNKSESVEKMFSSNVVNSAFTQILDAVKTIETKVDKNTSAIDLFNEGLTRLESKMDVNLSQMNLRLLNLEDDGRRRQVLCDESFYKLDEPDHASVNKYLSSLVERAVFELECSYCLSVGEDGFALEPTTEGRIASYYYIHHTSVRMFKDSMGADNTIPELLEILSNSHEYAELPVRHNEDQVNTDLAARLPLPVNPHTMDSSHTKTHLLLQAHFSQTPMPSSDYNTDLKSVLDQAIRVLQAMLDMACDAGWLVTGLRIIHLIQMVIQGRWIHDNCLLCLPHVENYHLPLFTSRPRDGAVRPTFPRDILESLPEVMYVVGDNRNVLNRMLDSEMNKNQIDEIFKVLKILPQISVGISISGWWEGTSGGQEVRPINLKRQGGRRDDADWIEVHADQEYVLQIGLKRLNTQRKRDSKAYCPRFGKPKDEGWIAVLGEIESQEVLALKRVGAMRDTTRVQLSFFTPEETGRVIYTLYLMSDAYLGLDQQYDLCLEVLPPSIEAQVNMELQDLDLED